MREYKKPVMNVEHFVSNEFISACGDENKVYNFECNAGNRNRKYNVFLNGPDDIAGTGDDIAWTTSKWYNPTHKNGYYQPCGATHQASVNDDFIQGYMYGQNYLGENSESRIDVIVWTDNGTNTHCTTKLDINSWTTTRS